ncbi:unnamed protein product, partial [Adineta steineri]
MGIGRSATVIRMTPQVTVEYVESEESKRMKVLFNLENQLEVLKNEVFSQPQLIVNGIQETVMEQSDVLILRYSDLTDMKTMENNVRDMFGNCPLLKDLVNTATQIIATMNNTKELTELMKWHQKTIKKLVGDKVFWTG